MPGASHSWPFKPRPYQVEAKRAIYRSLRRHRSTLAVMPTGTGKGAVIGMVVADAVAAGKRVLVFVHRKEIVDQLAGHVRAWSGVVPAIERAEQREATDASPVVVASVQSLYARLDRFAPDRFDIVIEDEAHHSLAASHLAVSSHFATAKHLGLTATPNRGDDLALGQVFVDVAVDIRLADSIRNGWLVPFRVHEIEVPSLDLSGVRSRSGDLMAGDLGAVLSEIKVLREAIVPAVQLAGRKQAIVFAATIGHMHAVAETVRHVAAEQGLTLEVATVDGTTPAAERDRIVADFRAGRINWLVNVGVATEGFDAPNIEVVIMLRPTMSQALYAQMLGRGTRPLPGLVDGLTCADACVMTGLAMGRDELPADPWVTDALAGAQTGDIAAARRLAIALSAKPELLVLDFAGNSSRHCPTRGMDLLGGDYDLPEQREAERMLARGDARNLLDALERARRQRQARRLEAMARAGDPFALFGLTPSPDRYRRPMTAKQSAALGPMPRPMDRREANQVLAEIERRRRLGLCLYSQAAILARLGHPIEPLRTLSRREASLAVRMAAANGWSR